MIKNERILRGKDDDIIGTVESKSVQYQRGQDAAAEDVGHIFWCGEKYLHQTFKESGRGGQRDGQGTGG